MEFFGAILIPTGDTIPAASADYIVAGLLDGAFLLAGIIGVVGLIMAAFRYVTANGDASAVTKAKQGIIYSIVGLIIVAIAFSLVRFVMTVITGGP
jgi:hypothetical protein